MQTKKFFLTAFLIAISAILPETAAAMPWDNALTEVKQSITGTVAQGVAVIAVVVTGLMVGMGEGGAAGRKAMQLLFGLALAFGAVQIIALFS